MLVIFLSGLYMKEVALFYGTYTGVTGEVAQKIVNELGADKVDIYNISKDGDKMEQYQKLIIGTSTWSIGELQEDWNDFMPKLQKMDFRQATAEALSPGGGRTHPGRPSLPRLSPPAQRKHTLWN